MFVLIALHTLLRNAYSPDTGGSCKKSPNIINLMPPNGVSWSECDELILCLKHMHLMIMSILSRNSADSIETSSMMRLRVMRLRVV